MARFDLRSRRRLLVISVAVAIVAAAAVIERDRFTASAIAAASCDDCSMQRKAAVAARAFATPQSVLMMPTIVGGRRTTSREFPTVGAILVDGELSCTGTIIGAHTVLTAAHCLDGIDAGRLSFKLGLDTTLPQPPPMTVSDRDIPNETNLTFDPVSLVHDVGVLHLTTPVTSGPLPRIDEDVRDQHLFGADVVKVGYGFDDPNRTGDGVQRRIELAVSTIEPLKFRHGGSGMSICFRDSGGPAFLSGRIVGVTSSTRGCREGADTRIALHAGWIKARIR